MKFKDYSFPHPVLGLGDDVGGTASVKKLDNDETMDNENYLLTIEYELDNPDLQKLVKEKKAVFLCEINCTGTLFRKSETCASPIQIVSIPKDGVRDKVELLFLLVSAEPIPDYTNSKVHSDFDGYKFDIEKGDVLAYLGESFFIAGIAYQKLKAVSAFMEIIRGENESGDFNIILGSQKIQIQLSKNDYEKYCDRRIGSSFENASIIHSSIVLPTLIHALYQLSKKNSDVTEYAWANLIKFRLENDENLNLISLEDNIPKIAQNLLGMPAERLMNDLFARVTATPEYEY